MRNTTATTKGKYEDNERRSHCPASCASKMYKADDLRSHCAMCSSISPHPRRFPCQSWRCPPEKPQGRLILGRPFSVVPRPRLRVSSRVLRHKVSLEWRAGLQKTQPLLLLASALEWSRETVFILFCGRLVEQETSSPWCNPDILIL